MRLLSTLLWLLFVAACGPREEPAPAAAPERVILFGPNLSATALHLGHAQRIVAITDYCAWPHDDVPPRVGGAIDPDLETIARLRPDLLVLQGRSDVLRSFAGAQGIRLADVKMDDDVASILRGIVTVDSLLTGGDTTRGRAAVDSLRRELAALRLSPQDEVPEVLLVISRDPDSLRNLLTAGAGTFLDDLLEHLGVRGWASSRGRGYFDVSLEELVAHPPDVVLEIASAGASEDPQQWRGPWVELLGADAEVMRLTDARALVPGPNVVDTARELSVLLRQLRPDGDPR